MTNRSAIHDYKRFPPGMAAPYGGRLDPGTRGYVYVIGFEEPGVVKIGSAKSVMHRIYELQCGNPFVLHCLGAVSIYDGDPCRIEMATHRLAAEHRLRGEWFLLDADDALRFIIKAARNAKAKFGPVIEAHEAMEAAHAANLAGEVEREEERRRILRVKLGME